MLRIDPEFRALIAPLQPDEYKQLEANLVTNGCRDALVMWRGTLIDGNHRLEICDRVGIEYRTIEMALPSREHVLLWIEQNQLGRRNLTDDQRAAIGLSISRRQAALQRAAQLQKAREQRGKPKYEPSVEATMTTTERARAAVARQARVSERKLRSVAAIERKDPDLFAKIRAGTMTIANAKFELQRANRLKIAAQINQQAPEFPEGPFRVLSVDPPWRYDIRQEDATHRARTPYPDMSVPEIQALPIPKLAHSDAILWLWTTNSFIEEACSIVRAWGLEKKTILTWVKDRMGTGAWLRGQTEHCIMAVRGNAVVTLTNQTTALLAPMRQHSRKPAEFYTVVEALCPGNKCELFARQQRVGWTSWGTEPNRFQTA